LNSSRTAEGFGDLAGITDDEIARLYYDWHQWALPKQLPPEGDWVTWLLMGGRG
jgi:phage terminase large subunit-like protein